MSAQNTKCVLLADPRMGLAEGIRLLLATMFETVVMVSDEASLQASALGLKPAVAVVDFALAKGGRVGVLPRLRANHPGLKLVVLCSHAEESLCRVLLEVGADAIVLRRAIATDLLPAIEAALAGQPYTSPCVHPRPPAH